jgi:hypothetical protein
MACVSGSNIVNDGLVFHFDMENGQKSWKGAPTINYLNAPLVPSSWNHLRDPNFGFISDEYFIYNGELGKNIPAYRRTLTGTDYRATRFDVPWSAHTQANVSLPLSASIYCRCLSPAPSTVVNINFQGTNSSGSRVDTGTSLPVSTEWTLLSDTRTLSNNGFVSLVNFGMKYYMNGNATPRTWEFMMPQVEQQPFATPFVNGARLSTASIVDLSPTRSTITAANLSYRENDTPTLDGTDDYLSTPTLGTLNAMTIETWVKSSSNKFASIAGDFSTITNSVGLRINWRQTGAVWTEFGEAGISDSLQTNVNINQWYHIVGMASNNNEMKMYINGALIGTRATTKTFTGGLPLYIGRGDFGEYFHGEISQVKIYNKALTDTEVKQNFEATRHRFGI